MPRRPTRSRRSQRPTRKDLSRRLQELTETVNEQYSDLPTLTLAELLSYETETVNEERGVVRVDGELRRFGDTDDDLLERLDD